MFSNHSFSASAARAQASAGECRMEKVRRHKNRSWMAKKNRDFLDVISEC